MSWLKLAEVAVNPFGEDDDDFDVVGLFDDHVRVRCTLSEFGNQSLLFLMTFYQMAQNLLELFESGQRNPTRQSMNMVQDTLVRN